MKKSFASDPIFSTVSDVPSRPCSPDVQHHPGHHIHSDHLDSFLNVTGREFWAIAVRQCVPVPRNVAQRRYHPHHTTHPKVGLNTFSWSMHHFRGTDQSPLCPCVYTTGTEVGDGGISSQFIEKTVPNVLFLVSAPDCTLIASAARDERYLIKRPKQQVGSMDTISNEYPEC